MARPRKEDRKVAAPDALQAYNVVPKFKAKDSRASRLRLICSTLYSVQYGVPTW